MLLTLSGAGPDAGGGARGKPAQEVGQILVREPVLHTGGWPAGRAHLTICYKGEMVLAQTGPNIVRTNLGACRC